MVYADDEYDEVDAGQPREGDVQVELRGAPLWLFNSLVSYRGPLCNREIIIASPGGTGKSRGIMQVLSGITENTPGMRGLLCRNTRESMGSSTLVEWEECFPQGTWSDVHRKNRSIYDFPNGSEVAAIGIRDNPYRIFSTKWDWIYFEELTEEPGIGEEEWGKFYRGLRGSNCFNNQRLLIGSCNPTYPSHWVKARIDSGECESHLSLHEDNPRWHNGRRLKNGEYDPNGWTEDGLAYIDGLMRMSEQDIQRLRWGKWIAAEGLVFKEYRENLHCIDGTIEREEFQHRLHVRGWPDPVDISWYMVSIDFGFRAPGVVQVWAVDESERLFRVAEVYQTGHNSDWWAGVLEDLYRDYPFSRGVADCEDKNAISLLNDRIGRFRGRGMKRVIQPADKSAGRYHGLEQLRWGFSAANGGPRTYLLRNALRYGADPALKERSKTTCLEEELHQYIWRVTKPGQAEKEEVDPNCADHAVDAAVYAHVFAWMKKLGPAKPKGPRYRPGTLGSTLRLNGKEIQWPTHR